MKRKIFFVLILVVCSTCNLYASGFGVFTQGARELGQGNAVTAHVTGPSSLYFNPALLTQVPGSQLEVGTTLILADREFTSDQSGLREQSDDSTQFPSTFYATHRFNDQLSAGLGVFFPFGLTTKWNKDWEGRYIATRSELLTTNFNPAVAYQVSPRLAVAAGVDILYLNAKLERQVNSTRIGFLLNPGGLGLLPDVGQKFSGNGWGLGYNLGLLFNLTDSLAFGASYRSQIDVEVEGDLHFSIPSGATALASVLTNTSGNTNARLPQQATFGLAWKASPLLTVEVGSRWEDWSSTKEVRITLDQAVLGNTVDVTPRDWDDSWAFNLGGQYRWSDTLTLLAGYLYSTNPVPDSTFSPSITDSDAQLFTVGTGLTFDRWTLNLAYGFEHYRDRNKSNAVGAAVGGTANGKYATDIHLVAASIGTSF